ncbi:MAG: amidohydrolase [Acidobacteria bacterium]|nr:amidohydrolase [Acidobacteriota bacterium]
MFAAAGAVLAQAQTADLILHNARVVSVNSRFEVFQAVAVKGNRIQATGSNATILRRKGPSTKVIDLGGKTVLPGLMDTHVHAADASMYEFDHEIQDMQTIADVLAYLRARAAVTPKGQWIRLSQVFITRLREQRYPSRAELDEVAPNHPVIFGTGPDASVNSMALRLSGITREKHPKEGHVGKIERDANGEPTGILRSHSQFVRPGPSGRTATTEDRLTRLKMMLADYNSVGITSVADRSVSDSEVDLYRELHKRGELTCRVFLNYDIDPNAPLEEVKARMMKARRDPLHTYNDMLWLRGLKAFLDGGMLTGSAYMREPWGPSKIYSIVDPNYRGMLYIQADRLYELTKFALQNDLQFTAHSVGDGAVQALVRAYERVNTEFPVRAQRPCLTHANFMYPEGIEIMKKVGIVADLQPAWLERDGATLTKHFGNPRMRYFQPYKSLFDAGVVVGGGSDHMQKIGSMRAINPYNPWWGMWLTLVRQPRWTDQPLHPEERITREQAIRLYTANNAFLMFDEKNRGSIEAGKLADLVVIDRDILQCPVDQVKDIRVERTWLGGREVFAVSKS